MTKPLLACRACGAETREEVELTGLLDAVVTMCDPCWTKALTRANELRDQFEALLAGGMSREQANKVMIARIDGEGAS